MEACDKVIPNFGSIPLLAATNSVAAFFASNANGELVHKRREPTRSPLFAFKANSLASCSPGLCEALPWVSSQETSPSQERTLKGFRPHLGCFKYAIKSASACGVSAASSPSGINEIPALFNDATSLRSTDLVMFPAIFSVKLALVSVMITP
jgi:hypothetical protein